MTVFCWQRQGLTEWGQMLRRRRRLISIRSPRNCFCRRHVRVSLRWRLCRDPWRLPSAKRFRMRRQSFPIWLSGKRWPSYPQTAARRQRHGADGPHRDQRHTRRIHGDRNLRWFGNWSHRRYRGWKRRRWEVWKRRMQPPCMDRK